MMPTDTDAPLGLKHDFLKKQVEFRIKYIIFYISVAKKLF